MQQMITQTQMQAFDLCKKLYYLRYRAKLVWPGELARRSETERGDTFHLLARQLIMGFPRDALLFPADDGTLSKWIETFCREKPLSVYERVYAEKELSALFYDVLWSGKFDALTVYGKKLTIFDWKTAGKKPDPEKYRTSPQTRLYRILAKSCGPRLLGIEDADFPAENIEMVYWFPEHPDIPLRFPYSESAWREDLTWLKTRAAEMSMTDESSYPMTARRMHCEYCGYRSYCYPELNVSVADLPDANAVEDPDEDIFQTEFFFPEEPPEQELVNF